MRRALLLLLLLALAFLGLGLHAASGARLLVYTYSSFASWGPAKFIAEQFEKETGAQVVFVATGDSRAMLARLIEEAQAGKPTADVFIGVEAADLYKAYDYFLPVKPQELPNLATVPRELLVDPENRLIPYEHGYITFVYDSQKLTLPDVPLTFSDLLSAKYRKKIILEDPRTSSVGLAFLLWTITHFGDPSYLDYWRRLSPNVLTIAGGWGTAYDLFLNGEAPIVLSFSTDTAYSVIENQSERYRVLLLDNEAYHNIYLMGVVRGTQQTRLARQFLNFVLSREVQEKIPTTEWMFPANATALLPVQFYQYAVVPPRPVQLDPRLVNENLERWLRAWAQVALGG